jgi:O-antigen ligase
MTTLTSNASAVQGIDASPVLLPEVRPPSRARGSHTLASSFVFLTICTAVVTTTLAYGTVHYWALAVFYLSAAAIVCLWCWDAWMLRSFRISRNALQWPLLGVCILGLVQLLPLRAAPDTALLQVAPTRALSLDPYSTRLFVVQVASLLIYFAATLVFVDSSRRLRTLVRTITVFGFLLAMFGLTQSLTSDGTRVYWIRELPQSTAFGPFINRHHFAGYMELAMAVPLGLLFTGAVERQKRILYVFAVILMGIGLIMTNSRGGMISLGAEIVFLVAVSSLSAKDSQSHSHPGMQRARAATLRAGLAFALLAALIVGVLAIGGGGAFSRLLGTPSADDPTTGRAHFWSVTLDIIKANPIVGAGFGAFGVVYTRYDSHNGLFRLEQAHNDYLQVLSDGGAVGGLLGLAFVVILFRKGLARREKDDPFRRGVVTGALAGCFAVLVHSFFDFTLHTTSNALLFLILAALATRSRVEETSHRRHRRS